MVALSTILRVNQVSPGFLQTRISQIPKRFCLVIEDGLGADAKLFRNLSRAFFRKKIEVNNSPPLRGQSPDLRGQ
jgi:hypothetical protein